MIALLCQDKVGHSPQIPTLQESLSDLLGLTGNTLGLLSPTTTEKPATLGSCKSVSLLLTQVKFILLTSAGV